LGFPPERLSHELRLRHPGALGRLVDERPKLGSELITLEGQGRPLILSFWFTRGGDCENQEDVFEHAYRRYKGRVNFLAIDVRDSDEQVRGLIASHHWTHPIGLDRDGALSNLFRVGGCPTFVYAYPGGLVESTSIGKLDDQRFFTRVDELIAASDRRDEMLR